MHHLHVIKIYRSQVLTLFIVDVNKTMEYVYSYWNMLTFYKAFTNTFNNIKMNTSLILTMKMYAQNPVNILT